MGSLEGAHDGGPEGNEMGPAEGAPDISIGDHGAVVGTRVRPTEGALGVHMIGAMGVGTPIGVNRGSTIGAEAGSFDGAPDDLVGEGTTRGAM
jgi:hypothetical protein